jgi:hypothetical protein
MLRAAIKPNRDGIQHLSITEDLHIYEVLIDSIREKTSASKEPILINTQFKNCFLSSLKTFQMFFINQNSLGKTCDTFHQHT